MNRISTSGRSGALAAHRHVCRRPLGSGVLGLELDPHASDDAPICLNRAQPRWRSATEHQEYRPTTHRVPFRVGPAEQITYLIERHPHSHLLEALRTFSIRHNHAPRYAPKRHYHQYRDKRQRNGPARFHGWIVTALPHSGHTGELPPRPRRSYPHAGHKPRLRRRRRRSANGAANSNHRMTA